MAIVTEDAKSLTAAQGIGKKIAQRIILELKDKMAKETASGLDFSGGKGAAAPAVVFTSKATEAAAWPWQVPGLFHPGGADPQGRGCRRIFP